ncbi:MAG: phosphoesterase [Verrucomicrobiota bacterium]|nr:phosphoesterase [Verrucomicrobiota bacterium]
MIDLHVHSSGSDGTCSPAELAEMGRDFYAMALTDHDNCDGVEEFLRVCGSGHRDSGRIRLAGIELSVDPGEGYGIFHLLGLGMDPENEGLKGLLHRILDGRNERNAKILARFESIGIRIPADEIAAYAHGDILARPHFAKWLVDHGYSGDVKAAFDAYLTPSSPPETKCYVSRFRPDPKDAFDAIHAAGGAAIMAHPRYWTKDPSALRTGLSKLKAAGLDGIEAIYQANESGETVEHVRAAKELGLCMTAGSDFHGSNKPSVTLGMDVDDEVAFLRPLLERIGFWRNA